MKKFVISTEILKPMLAKLSQAINAKATLPILQNIYCKASGQQIELIASDTEVTIFLRAEALVTGSFETLIPFSFLAKVVALNKQCPLTVELEKTKLKVTGPDDVYELKGLNKIADYPKLPEQPTTTEFALDTQILQCLKSALLTVGKDEKHARFTKVLMEVKEGKMTIASSDGGYVVFSKAFDFTQAQKINDEVLISARAIKAIDDVELVNVKWDEKMIAFTSENMTVLVTQHNVKYVDFRKVFIPEFTSNLTLNRLQLIGCLEKCSMSSDLMKMVKIHLKESSQVKLTADDHMLNIAVSMPGEYKGNVEMAAIHFEKMLNLLNQVQYENIELAIHDPSKAILLRSAEDADYLAMIMPIATS